MNIMDKRMILLVGYNAFCYLMKFDLALRKFVVCSPNFLTITDRYGPVLSNAKLTTDNYSVHRPILCIVCKIYDTHNIYLMIDPSEL